MADTIVKTQGDARPKPHFHPRAAAGRDRWLAFGKELVRVRPNSAILLFRWRSPRKPGPFVCDAFVPADGERVALIGRPDVVGTVLI
jgi:hypothetical protein